jgi:hypothetical protein
LCATTRKRSFALILRHFYESRVYPAKCWGEAWCKGDWRQATDKLLANRWDRICKHCGVREE